MCDTKLQTTINSVQKILDFVEQTAFKKQLHL